MLIDYENELQYSMHILKSLKFDKKHRWHQILVMIYTSIIEYSRALIAITSRDEFYTFHLIFKSLIECYVDFYNLVKDKSYGYHIDAADLKEYLKFLNLSNALINEHEILVCEKKLSELKNKGYKPLKVYQKFEMAGMKSEYEIIYFDVCLYAHNNKIALIDRHLEINEEENGFELTSLKKYVIEDFEHYLHEAFKYLKSSNFLIREVLAG